MINRTILKFNDDEIYEVHDEKGRPIDSVDIIETLDEVNRRICFELFDTNIIDDVIDNEDVTIIYVYENDSPVITEEIIEDGNDELETLFNERGWFKEDVDQRMADGILAAEEQEREEDAEFDEDDDDYSSDTEDFEDE